MTFIAESYAVMTAAEIAAAEVAAATAAEVAAAEAAAAAAQTAAAEAATQAAAQQSAQQGITAASGAAPPPIGAPATPPPIGVPATPLPPAGSTPVGLEQLGQQGFANPEDAARFDQFVKAFGESPVDTGYSPYAQFAEGPVTSDAPAQLVQTGSPINPNIVDVPPGAESEIAAPEFESLTRKELADYTKSEVGSNSFLEGFDAIGKYIKDNPYKSAMYGYTGLSALSALDRPSAPQSQKRTYRRNYVVSPNFVASSPTRPNPYYKPTYAAEGGVMNSFDDSSGMDEPAGLAQGNLQKGLFGLGYADGGITNFAKGTPRDYYADLRRYQAMLESPESQNIEEPYRRAYIVRDDDLDTRYENAFDASIIRLGKNYKRANIGAPVIRRPTPLGTINLSPPGTQQAASGGIMGYNLGGYADGGNPRLLKGPGDGMSDNIPAVIGNSQPARLADGEFVVPADVVSHLGNGSTDAGAKKLHKMMDKIRQARTGKKKQAPQVNVDKYLPMGKASGGIAGYASGGAIGYAEGGDINPTIAKIYQEQFGRAADSDGAKYWSDQLAQGKTVAEVSKAIAQAKEGQDMDIQAAASAYRQALGRTPEPEGLQYWLSTAQSKGLTSDQLKNEIANAAVAEQTQRGITKPFTDPLQLASLEANPYAGYYSEKDIYDVAPDAENVSMIDGRKVQFTTPVTRQGVVSQYKDGVYTTASSPTLNVPITAANFDAEAYLKANPDAIGYGGGSPYQHYLEAMAKGENRIATAKNPVLVGKDVLNLPHVQAAINAARANGTFNDADYATLTTSLDAAKTAAEVRAALSRPQGQVVIDALQGQQIGEAKTLADAQAEAALRQPILTAQMAQNPGYYQSNRVLSDAYKAAGLTVPFDYSTYQGVDTRDRTSNLFTPENFQQKQNELVNTLNRSNPYRPTYQPINRGIANMPTSVQDPYSDAGLKVLYGQMMNQYAPAPPGQMNPATYTPANPFTYRPAPQNNLVLQNPITDAVTAAANQAKADAVAAANASTAGDAGGAGSGGERAGGLLSINRKRKTA